MREYRGILQSDDDRRGVARLRMSLLAVLLGLFVIRSSPAKAQSLHDYKGHLNVLQSIIQELENCQYELLESQYRQFHRLGEETADGTPKIWLYFAAFYEKNLTLTANQEEAEAFTQKARAWYLRRPNSVPALLALGNALLGECGRVRATPPNKTLGQGEFEHRLRVQARVDEYDREVEAIPKEAADALRMEPYYYVVAMHFLAMRSAPFELLQKLGLESEQVEAYYVPFYLDCVSWLSSHRLTDPSLPRPEIWLTNRCKPDLLDPEEINHRKCRAYAQVIAFHGGEASDFKPALLDWPTLKAGLQDLVRSYGPQTDWPSRFLVSAYAFHDQEGAQEALMVIAGNYSPEIINDPHAFEEMSRWAASP